jgi:hypothetical protein
MRKNFEKMFRQREVNQAVFYTENPRNISAKNYGKLIQAAGVEQCIHRPNFTL